MLQAIIVGLVLGSIYALAASGLVITYVSTGVLNFAFGALAFFVARVYYWMHVEKGWGILLSAGVCLFILSPAIGLGLYLGIFRFLRLSSQLIKVVVTLGLSVLIAPVAEVLFGQNEIFAAPGLAPEPASVYHVFGTTVNLNNVITYACVLAIVAIGAMVLRFTDAGLAVRAMVDSEAMTSLSGSNPSRIAGGVWVVSMFLAGLAGILAAPVINLDAGKYTLLTAAAFAAVIAARLRSLPVAVFIAVLMGVASSVAQYYLPTDSELTAGLIPSIPFIFIVISLIVNVLRSGRVNEEEGVGGALDRAILPHGGSRLAASADVDNPYPKLNFYFPVALFAIFVGLVFLFHPFWLGQFGRAAALAVLFLSFTLVTGEGGMLWLCQVAFAGVGALATAQFATVHGWPIMLAVFMGGVVAAAIGVVIGLLTIRLGNLYIALVTLTFSLLMERLVFTLNVFAQNGVGYPLQKPSFATTDVGYAILELGIFAVFAILIVNLRRSTTGLALNAVRWSETASRTMGLSVLQMKLLVSGLAAFVAGIGGGLYALQENQALPADYVTLLGLVWLAVLVTFGVRSNIAALLAAFLFTLSPTFNTKILPDWLGTLGIHLDDTLLSVLPVIGFGVGAILLAKNPEGTVHMQAMQFQSWLQKRSGARAVPAATAIAGRHDPRLSEPAAVPDGADGAEQTAGQTATTTDEAAEVPRA
ncbi:MAG TPA: ABC transporter permease [Acidimicrobiia bacterium]